MIIFCLIWFGKQTDIRAQLSPGDLSEAHAHLDGISNCTQCHELGQKVTNQKCLECHQFLKSRIDADRGYHTSPQIAGKECIQCHSEHHGRKFEMIRFDRDRFDHTLAGYPLEGAHQTLECRQCHRSAFIVENGIRERENTFLGLDTDCLNCHDDYHRRSLSYDCRSCHDMQAFRPAPEFDHARTDFPLKGQHRQADCASCHAIETVDGKKFQHFSGIAFQKCSDCHEDAHNNRLGPDCASCHSEDSFHSFAGAGHFDHDQTSFPLKGKHEALNCATCHEQTTTGTNAFREFEHKVINQCSACHTDVHDGKFGADCASCHNENSFQAASGLPGFDHSRTDFALEGKHRAVDCKACHTGAMTDPVAFGQCMDCHTDYHQGDFTEILPVPDCAACHEVGGFAPSTFTMERHNETRFPLTGGHMATPCFACHLEGDQWAFSEIGNACVDCHEDIHEGLIGQRFYPEENCASCHTTDTWSSVSFDHSTTDFRLEGAHTQVSCSACHIADPPVQVFAGLDHNCSGCHEDNHRGQFARDGSTDCARCHGTEDWSADRFDHNATDFRLEGEHAATECTACHVETETGSDRYIIYQIEKFACIDCHQ